MHNMQPGCSPTEPGPTYCYAANDPTFIKLVGTAGRAQAELTVPGCQPLAAVSHAAALSASSSGPAGHGGVGASPWRSGVKRLIGKGWPGVDAGPTAVAPPHVCPDCPRHVEHARRRE
jgi:hypothetical protein